MFCKHHILYFLAGAAAMHTISHIAAAYAGILPMTVWGILWTQQLNTIVIAVSAVITLGLLYLAGGHGSHHTEIQNCEIKK